MTAIKGVGYTPHFTPSVVPPPGPPFALNSANNGLSVDAGTGEIVLGNDAGTGLGGSAMLLNGREIDMNGNLLQLFNGAIFISNSPGAGQIIMNSGQFFVIDGVGNTCDMVSQGVSVQDTVGHTLNALANELNLNFLVNTLQLHASDITFLDSVPGDTITVSQNAAELDFFIGGTAPADLVMFVDLLAGLTLVNSKGVIIDNTPASNEIGDLNWQRVVFTNGGTGSQGQYGNSIASVLDGGTGTVSSMTPFQISSGGSLKQNDTAKLIDCTSAMANGAGGAAGTLLNSPLPGNPTKWIPFLDGGVLRHFPAW